MYKIVDNFMEASCFFTHENLHYNVQLFKNNPDGYSGSLKVVKYKNSFYLSTINTEGVITGYLKLNNIKETPSNIQIDMKLEPNEKQ